jgi:hypothetical protein
MELKAILSSLTKYRDLYGLLTQKSKDGGDSLQRTGSLYSLLGALRAEQDDRGKSVREGLLYDIDKYLSIEGRYRRHPNGHLQPDGKYFHWYANPDNLSRDQSIVLQAAMVINGCKGQMTALAKQRMKRLFFHFNTQTYDDQEPLKTKFPDMPSPIEFAQFIRGLEIKWLYPLLLILDLQLLGELIAIKLSDRAKYDSDNMLIPIMLSCLVKMKTPIGALAKILYARTDAVARVKAYYAEGDNKDGIVPMGDLYELAFNKLIKG